MIPDAFDVVFLAELAALGVAGLAALLIWLLIRAFRKSRRLSSTDGDRPKNSSSSIASGEE